MSEERAGRLRTRIASGRLSSECTTGFAAKQELLLLDELLLLLLDEPQPPPPTLPLGFEELLVTATQDCRLRELRDDVEAPPPPATPTTTSVQLPDIGLDACECDDECDEADEELCELL